MPAAAASSRARADQEGSSCVGAAGSTRVRVITAALISRLPAFSKLAVTRSPITDCTSRRPHSGACGFLTQSPGARPTAIAHLSAIGRSGASPAARSSIAARRSYHHFVTPRCSSSRSFCLYNVLNQKLYFQFSETRAGSWPLRRNTLPSAWRISILRARFEEVVRQYSVAEEDQTPGQVPADEQGRVHVAPDAGVFPAQAGDVAA